MSTCCSKHVEAWNKYIEKSASSWSLTRSRTALTITNVLYYICSLCWYTEDMTILTLVENGNYCTYAKVRQNISLKHHLKYGFTLWSHTMFNIICRDITQRTEDVARGVGVTSYAQKTYIKVNTITGIKNAPFAIRNYQKIGNEIKRQYHCSFVKWNQKQGHLWQQVTGATVACSCDQLVCTDYKKQLRPV